MSPVFVTTSFLVQKALKTANSEKFVFSCQTSKVVPEPPSSLVFRRKPAPGVRRAPNSVFCPEKPANSSPLNSSPLAFWVQKCAKPGPVPELLLRRVFRGPTARRGPGLESVSPPRWSPLMSFKHVFLGIDVTRIRNVGVLYFHSTPYLHAKCGMTQCPMTSDTGHEARSFTSVN